MLISHSVQALRLELISKLCAVRLWVMTDEFVYGLLSINFCHFFCYCFPRHTSLLGFAKLYCWDTESRV